MFFLSEGGQAKTVWSQELDFSCGKPPECYALVWKQLAEMASWLPGKPDKEGMQGGLPVLSAASDSGLCFGSHMPLWQSWIFKAPVTWRSSKTGLTSAGQLHRAAVNYTKFSLGLSAFSLCHTAGSVPFWRYTVSGP